MLGQVCVSTFQRYNALSIVFFLHPLRSTKAGQRIITGNVEAH